MASKLASSPPEPRKHISEQTLNWQNWYLHVNWLNVAFIGGLPLVGCILALWTPLNMLTAIWAVIYYFCTGLGITAGYHRLWAHRSYRASLPLELVLALFGAGAMEGSIRWWSRDHRSHHRFTDSAKDPYSVRKGLIYSHIGWMVMKQDPKRIGRSDISDLNENPIVVWQHKNYVSLALFMALIFPALVASLWGDFMGGFVYAAILRVFFVQQATFCVNSLAHWLGDQPFDDKHSPRDHVFTALITLGEGYHNFHHEFPSDFRNALEWYQYDPTKWLIWSCYKLGLAYNLKTFRANEIEKGRVQQLQKKLDSKRNSLDWGVPLEKLPCISWDEYIERADEESLVLVAGVVHSVAAFVADHPGGKALISSAVGKDATAIFNGGVYDHSNAAHNLLSTMRIAVLFGGGEVEIWKRPGHSSNHLKDKEGNLIVRAGQQPTRTTSPIASAEAA